MLTFTLRRSAAACLMLAALTGAVQVQAQAPAKADIKVSDVWVRSTVAAQKASGAFMQITSAQDTKLVGVSSPVAGTAEMHQMEMNGNVMKMRQVDEIALPAGKPVELKSGGYHIMLLNLKGQIKPGDQVPLTLTVEGKDKHRQTIEVTGVARPLNSAAAMPMH